MRTILTSIAAAGLFAALATAEPKPRYTVNDLGTLPGGSFSQATAVGANGLVTGLSTVADGTQHAFLWYKGRIMDIGKPGLGGPNSAGFGTNERGQVLVQAEGSAKDPNNENFCGYGSGFRCMPAVWQNGMMTQLPTLGGPNGTVGMINNRGEAAGIAEKSTVDQQCPPGVALNGTGPQRLDFGAVVWGPKQGEIRELHPLPGDSVAIAMWINDDGQATGTSGRCSNTVIPPFVAGPHAVRWDKDGSAHDLGNLGGTSNLASLGVGNIGFVINNRGDVAGVAATPGNTGVRAFLWTKQTGMRNLGTLPGHANSAAQGMNNKGDVVGVSVDGTVATGDPHPFLWQNGRMADLNDLIPDSPVYMLIASSISDAGEIAGFGVHKSAPHDVHAFLASPGHGEEGRGGKDDSRSAEPAAQGETSHVALPEYVRELVRKRFGSTAVRFVTPR